MGIDSNGLRGLLYLKKIGVDFSRTAMIGRQFYVVDTSTLQASLEAFGHHVSDQEVERLLVGSGYYIEPLLSFLGADLIHSFDNSAYEGASHVHDMNCPISDAMKNQYTLVIDSGTLEHVFNYPVAIANCMQMVAVGGTCVLITPANNFCGHGFYQFSPELFFDVFSSINGFEIQDVIAFEDKASAQWYSVQSPMHAKQRVMLQSGLPVYLLIIAKKIADVDVFRVTPQQSDYAAAWDRSLKQQSTAPEEMAGVKSVGEAGLIPMDSDQGSLYQSPAYELPAMKRLTPIGLKRSARKVVRRLNSVVLNPFNPQFFTPIDPTSDR